MENNSKKYFLKETGEELKFGDIIELNCVKELEDGRATIEREIKFSPETVEALMQFELIEEKEPLIDFSEDEEEDDFDFDGFMEAVEEDLDDHEDRIQKLEKKLKVLEQSIKNISNSKNASPKK